MKTRPPCRPRFSSPCVLRGAVVTLATVLAGAGIAQEKFGNGALDREKTRARLLDDVARSWQRPGIQNAGPGGGDVSGAIVPLAKKLDEIVIPHLSFAGPDANLAAVIDALGSLSEQYDNSDTGPRGANLVLVDPDRRNPLVRLTLRDVSLKRVLDLLAEQVGYQYEIQADAVLVRPAGETSNLETQFFPVRRATVLRMTGIAGPGGGGARDAYPAGGTGGG
ncbi:MAG: STN domain-containing protein, partial [Opitutus sp.]